MKRPGEILRKRREELGLSLQELESNSNIPRRLLEALENDQSESFAAESYYRGFLQNYAENLKLDPKILLNAYQNVKIIESPLPMQELTGNVRKKKFSPLILGIIILLLFVLLSIFYLGVKTKSETNNQNKEPFIDQKTSPAPGKKIIVNRYPWMQNLQQDSILQFVLEPNNTDLLRPEMQVHKNSQGFQLISLNLNQNHELSLASGKTNSLPLSLPSSSNPTADLLLFRLDFTLQETDQGSAVLINLTNNSNPNKPKLQSQNFQPKELNDKFQAFKKQYSQTIPHHILQANKPLPLQLQMNFLRDSYIRYQWSGHPAQEYSVLKSKQLLLQGEAPLTLWLSDVGATKMKINGHDLAPNAFQNVFVGRLEWKRSTNTARLYLTLGS